MWLAINADKVHPQFLHFMPPVKNLILDRGTFSRILYAPANFTMNGLYMHTPMTDKLAFIERDILNAYNSPKTKTYCLNRHPYAHNAILKISGVWETDSSCGIAFKFIHPS